MERLRARRVVAPDRPTAQQGDGSDLRALAKGSALSLAGTVGQGALSFALVLVITRSLGPRGAGFFFQMVALFTIFSVIEMGADAGLVRFISRFRVLHRRDDLGTTFKLALYPVAAMSLAIGAATFIAAPALARLFFSAAYVEDATLAIRILVLFQPLAAVSDVLVGGTRGLGTVVPYVAVEALGKPFLRLVLILIVAATGMAGVGTVMAWAIPIAIGLPVVAVWNVLLLRRLDALGSVAPAPVKTSPRQLASEFWRFCIPQGFSALLLIGVRWFDVLLVGGLRSAGEAGVYAAVSRTVIFGLFAIDAIRIALAPQISGLFAGGDRQRAESVYRFATWWLIIVSWPLYLTLCVFAPVVLGVFGSEFETGQHALLLLALGMLVGTVTGNVLVVLSMGGKSGLVLFDTAASLATNVALNLVLIPKIGIEGAAIAWVASIAVVNLLALWQVRRYLHVDPFGRGFAIATTAAVACFGGIELLLRWSLGPSPLTMATSLVLAGTAYLGLLFHFRSTLQLGELKRSLLTRKGVRPEAVHADEDELAGTDTRMRE